MNTQHLHNDMVVVDCETGGIDPSRCALLGVGAVRLRCVGGAWEPAEMFEALVAPSPGLEIDARARAVNGWPGGAWKDGLCLPEDVAARWFDAWLDGVLGNARAGWTLAGFSTEFDRGFLEAWQGRAVVKFPMPHADRRSMDLQRWVRWHARAMLPLGEVLPSRMSADAVSEWLGVEPEAKPHLPLQGALWAARAICLVLNRLQELRFGVGRSA